SPEKRCGKTTLLSVLSELANRAIAASNVSPPALFRVIEDLRPTLIIDEVDTFLTGNEQLRGILNSGYNKKTAFVLRVSYEFARDASETNERSLSPSVDQPAASTPQRLLPPANTRPPMSSHQSIYPLIQPSSSQSSSSLASFS